MALYSISDQDSLRNVKENSFKLEREIQSLTEGNLSTILGLDFASSEFQIKTSV